MKHFALVLVFLVLSAMAGQAQPDPAIARYLAWRGGELETAGAISQSGTIATAGLEGSAVRRLTRDSAYFHAEFGPLVVSEGLTPEDAWSLTTSGQVETMDPITRLGHERFIDIAFALSLRDGRVSDLGSEEKDGVAYRVFRAAHAGGGTTDSFIGADGAMRWLRAVDDRETIWISLEDWVLVDGVRMWRKETIAPPVEAGVQVIAWSDTGIDAPFDETLLERPAAVSRLAFLEPAPVTVPIRIEQGVRILADISVNGTSGIAILDSGAEASVLDADFAARAGIAGEGAVRAKGTGGETTAAMASGVTVRMGGVELKGITAAVLDLSGVKQRTGLPFDVIVGKELFNEAIIAIDYDASRLTVHDPAIPYAGPGAQIDLIAAAGGLRQIAVGIEGQEPGLFDFDLGNGSALVVFESAAKAWNLLDGRRTSTLAGGGVGGVIERTVLTVSTLKIGPYTFTQIPTRIAGGDGETGAFDTDRIQGNIGAGVLKRFKLTIDYSRSTLHLEPYDWSLSRPFDKDRSGVQFTWEEDALLVLHVAPGSPAESAGLKKGAVVAALNGAAPTAATWAEAALAATHAPAGTSLTLTLADGTQFELVLADYF